MNNTTRTGYGLIAAGILFLLLRLTGFTVMSLLWPLWVLIPGALMLYTGYNGKQANLGWLVPGALVGGTGAILFFLNLTGRWEAWAYMWALYSVFVGAAVHYTGQRNGNERQLNGGMNAMRSGLWTLVAFGLFFELLIFGGLGFLDSALVPTLLIAVGGYLLYARDRIHIDLGAFRDGKPKRRLPDPETGINPDLRRRMDEALADEDQRYGINRIQTAYIPDISQVYPKPGRPAWTPGLFVPRISSNFCQLALFFLHIVT